MLNGKRLWLPVILLVLMGSSTGCATNKTVLYPLTDKDIFVRGDTVCFSNYYLDHVMKVKIEAR